MSFSKQCCHLRTPNDVRYPQRQIPGSSPDCDNHKKDNLSFCFVHFSNLPRQILTPPYFHLIRFHDVLIPRYRNAYQYSFMIARSCAHVYVKTIALQTFISQNGHRPTQASFAHSWLLTVANARTTSLRT